MAMIEGGSPPRVATIAVVIVCVAMGAISALEAHHVAGTHGFPIDVLAAVASTTPRWILLAVVLPFVLRVGVRYPVLPVRAPLIALHVAIFLATSAAHAIADSWAVTITNPLVVQMFGMIPRLTRSWLNTMPTMVSMYTGVLVAAWGITEFRERQRRTLRASQLESQLQSARLAALRAQLQPHFLYNTLNGIAALVDGVQPRRAVAAIEQLSELLHASLREDGREEVTVDEEVALAEKYLALQRMRFGERLQYECDVSPDASGCLVPVLVLQPIVENAVVHGLEAGQEVLRVWLEVRLTAEGLELVVTNDGTLLEATGVRSKGKGLGLSATRARLITAYGDRGSLTLKPRPGGGAVVRIVLPRQVAADARPAVSVTA
jgi:hypothetical protein